MAHPLLEPPTLHEEIRAMGTMSALQNENDVRYRETENRRRDAQIYGPQNNGTYTMEGFIIEVLEIPREELIGMNTTERTEFIINFAVEAIGKKEIHFTPAENTNYAKIKVICEKLVDDHKKMICRRMRLSPCPRDVNDVIREATNKLGSLPRSIIRDMPIGYKLLLIEKEFSNRVKASVKPKGGGKTKRKNNNKSRRRNNKSKGRN